MGYAVHPENEYPDERNTALIQDANSKFIIILFESLLKICGLCLNPGPLCAAPLPQCFLRLQIAPPEI